MVTRTIILLPLLLLLPAIQGCAIMIYPVARACGSPSESDLKKCRVAFDRLKAEGLAARMVIYPATDPVGMRKDAYPGTAMLMAEQLRSKGWTNCTVAPAAPLVEPSPLGHNQLRYAWNRAHILSQWVKTTRPGDGFHVFVEILTSPSG